MARLPQKMTARCFLIIFLATVTPSALNAQAVVREPDPARQVHWAMGAFFGTGWYQVDQNRSIPLALSKRPVIDAQHARYGPSGPKPEIPQ